MLPFILSGIFLTILWCFLFRILGHNKIRVLRNGSFFGLYALEKLWVANCLSSFINTSPFPDCCNFMFTVCMIYMWCIHAWTVILACFGVEKNTQGISEIWAALCVSIQRASVQKGGWYTQTGYYRVILKSSHNYTSVLRYQVSPTPQDKIRRSLGGGALWQLRLWLTDSLALLSSIIISLNDVLDSC